MESYLIQLLLIVAGSIAVLHADPDLSNPLNLPTKWSFEQKLSDDYVQGSIWPNPQAQKPDGKVFSLLPNKFSFSINGKTSDVLKAAVNRYMNLTFPDFTVTKKDDKLPFMEGAEVIVVDDYKPMDLTTDESYTLTVTAPQSSIYAYTVWGALRGLETFSQIVHQSEDGMYYAKGNKIEDYPRFHHRAFMIDTSRHYLKLSIIKKFLDAMSYAKFNVLHWHVVDDDSFPFQSQTFPSLSDQGSFNNKTHVYSPADVADIIDYARMRGIRVIPEFDTPGHTYSWRSIPNLLTKCCDAKGKPTGSLGPIDPTIDSNYDFLKAFFGEVAKRFPDQYIHLGGDEVGFGCWQSNPNITAWMEKMRFGTNYSKLEEYYETKLLNIIGGLGKQYIIWQEVVDNDVKVLPDTVVNVWKGGWPAELAKVTGAKKLKAILSSPWYLNYISYGIDWPNYYKVEPTDFEGTDQEKELVIGGTGCMWGEFVDGTNILARTWPRALAIAERLWSSKSTTDMTSAYARIWEHRCRYLLRGIPAEPAVEAKFCRKEWPIDE
ncbi:beta-hexosaminidase subunit alpha isoform X1 [Nematostella vectensis]|uniref:beta-hexosaminidase subunit alpha isoform X1 n=1 Tax=Nematostella vectensis TaxID=45351 RepID=UPI0020771B09|nr:beta-hexosaminidase subunit alpha isoform X1 [Nematostella vectensis]